MHCPAHNTQTHTATQNEENDKMLVTTSIASDRKDQCLFPKKMFLWLVFALFIWISRQLFDMLKLMFPNKAYLHCYNQRIFVIICEGRRLSKRWPVVLMCDLVCQFSRDGGICWQVHCAAWPPSPSLPLTPLAWHLYPDQPRSKITNKTKPPIVQATPNLLTSVTGWLSSVMFANLFSHSRMAVTS